MSFWFIAAVEVEAGHDDITDDITYGDVNISHPVQQPIRRSRGSDGFIDSFLTGTVCVCVCVVFLCLHHCEDHFEFYTLRGHFGKFIKWYFKECVHANTVDVIFFQSIHFPTVVWSVLVDDCVLLLHVKRSVV